jgi:apolipoprotein N-acyltransferase
MRLPKLASPGDGAQATPISVPPQAKTMDLRWLWLLIGFVLLPFTAYRVVFPLAAWIAPVFLLRFERVSRRGGPALWLIFAAYMLAGVIDLIGIPDRGLWLFLGLTGFPLFRAVRFTLPYVTDRLLGARLGTWPRMLLFPASFVASDWLMGLIHLTGTFGSPAYSQYGVLPLMQLVSVTGMYGLTFLVMWFASAVNAVWEHGFRWQATRLPLAVFGSVLAAVFAFGFARLSLAAPTSPTVKAATITISPAVFNQANNGLDLTTFNRATSQQRAAWRPRFTATVDQMLARTQTALSQGAKLVVWQEQSALVLPGEPTERHRQGRGAGPQQRCLPGHLARRPHPVAVPALLPQPGDLDQPGRERRVDLREDLPRPRRRLLHHRQGLGRAARGRHPVRPADHGHLLRPRLPRTTAPGRAKGGRHPARAEP